MRGFGFWSIRDEGTMKINGQPYVMAKELNRILSAQPENPTNGQNSTSNGSTSTKSGSKNESTPTAQSKNASLLLLIAFIVVCW